MLKLRTHSDIILNRYLARYELEACLKKCWKDPDTVTRDFIRFELDLSREKDKDVMAALKDTRLPSLRKFAIQGLSGVRTQEDTLLVQKFLKSSIPEDLPTFWIHNGTGSHWKYLEEYLNCFEYSLKSVTQEVYIFGFRLSAATLVHLIQLCSQVQRLSIVNCEIEDGQYNLPLSIPYKIKELNISSNTCDYDDEDCMNTAKLDKLFGAISKTSMKQTLKQVFVNGDRFPTEDLEDILKKRGLPNVQVSWKYELRPID